MTRRNRKPSPSDTVVVGAKSLEQLWSEVAPFGLPDAPPASEGWMTNAEVAGRMRIAKQSAHNRLMRMVREGKVERIYARSRDKLPPMYYYRPVRS